MLPEGYGVEAGVGKLFPFRVDPHQYPSEKKENTLKGKNLLMGSNFVFLLE